MDIAKVRQDTWDELNSELITISKATNESKSDILKMTVNELMSLWTAHNKIFNEQEKARKKQAEENKRWQNK